MVEAQNLHPTKDFVTFDDNGIPTGKACGHKLAIGANS
jgi:hypothetical protein